jgi:hypothetical protein
VRGGRRPKDGSPPASASQARLHATWPADHERERDALMATQFFTVQRVAASLVGAGLVGLSGWFTWEHSHDVTAPIAAIVGAGMFHFGENAWRARRWLTALLLGALGLLAVLISLLAVIDRTSSRYDAANQSRASENVPRDQAQKALAREEKALEKAEADASAKCRSGDGLKCKSLKLLATEARERLAKARTEFTKLGARTAEDPAARRIAAVLGVSEAQVGMMQPLLLPVWLELSGLVLLTYGLSSPTRLPEAPAEKPKRKARKQKQAPRKPAAQSGVTDWVAAYTQKHGRPPKVADVRQAFGVSKTTAWRRIRNAS